ncbi:MAG: hypothetical protein WAN76_01925 [Candidatus Sulfotelmatobacter sp.]
MKKQFSIDKLIIENGIVLIRGRSDEEFRAAMMQYISLVKAGCTVNEVLIQARGQK